MSVTHSLVASLRQVPNLRDLDDEDLLKFVGASSNLIWPEGATIFSPGDRAEALYVVLTGQVAIEDEGGEQLAELGPGDYFGEQPLLEASTHSRRAAAVADCELLVLPRTSMEALLGAYPELGAPFGIEVERRTRARDGAPGGQPDASA